ncbi:MAG: hypothetical protein J5496_03060 [Lachnospiraceae bacterium]|nr:hypothetical protein [Lachnospiraceae bacterium]
MTKEDLKKAILDTEDEWIEEALPKGFGKTRKVRSRWFRPALAAAACVLIAVLGLLLLPRRPDPNTERATDKSILEQLIENITPVAHAFALAEAEYPDSAIDSSLYPRTWKEMTEKYAEIEAKYMEAHQKDQQEFAQVRGNGESLKPFLQQAIRLSLENADGKNALSAPLNLYFGLAMLAESTAGETRQEILDAIGAGSLEALREQAGKVWRANYYDDGNVKSILGSSLWLSDSLSYNKNTVKQISESYYASVFRGEMGTEEYNEVLRQWINAQTGSLLEELTAQLSMVPQTVLELVSTVYFQDRWDAEFSKENNRDGIFHGAAQETAVTFMNQTDWYGVYYYGEHFGAYAKRMRSSDAVMYFILPDEGVSMEELLTDEDLQAFLTSDKAVPNVTIKVNFSLPKFDIMMDQDLSNAVKALGIQKVFDPQLADFSSVTGKADAAAWLSEVRQGARIMVDEEGVKAAAYLRIVAPGAPMPPEEEIDFVLDRPFLFVLRSRDDLPLLAGIVNQP